MTSCPDWRLLETVQPAAQIQFIKIVAFGRCSPVTAVKVLSGSSVRCNCKVNAALNNQHCRKKTNFGEHLQDGQVNAPKVNKQVKSWNVIVCNARSCFTGRFLETDVCHRCFAEANTFTCLVFQMNEVLMCESFLCVQPIRETRAYFSLFIWKRSVDLHKGNPI